MEKSPARQFDFERTMLWGDHLRVLLNSEHISPGEINETLREKGIFIDSIEKSITVPLLSSCLLTPDEFKRLVERSFVRESGKKYSSCTFKLTSPTADWKAVLLSGFEEAIGGLQPDTDKEFASEPALSVEPNGDLKVTYSLRVLDFSKDWIEQELIYPAEITLKVSGSGLSVEADRSHTSKDTDRMNDKITRALGRLCKARGVTEDEKPDSILFDDFVNSDRIRFFLQLTAVSSKEFSFSEIDGIEIIRDQTAGSLPKDPQITWMEDTVNKIKINGKDLGKIFLLYEPDYYQFYFLVKMTVTYAFKFGANVGTCGIEYYFSGKSTRGDDYSGTMFGFCIDRLSRVEKSSQASVRKSIIKQVQQVRDSALSFVKLTKP
ncbi:hypothetical protein JFT60_12575 [Pseudomonas sp. MF6772]|uniref:GapS4b family protein n=1 Tax=Pseudomonas sp. MF6772 TaxID=2797533 RepID=UPI0018E6FB79|nr:hypothetical protein [Pseudomonas sp. MF6772]MBJ2268207.1 hypothetical protein [Pseudomonas sp. MF6772]